jgi:Fe-Mn family superoxide dismutase
LQGALATALAGTFGSLDAFFKEFSDEALAIFGSGWAWLYVDHDGALKITATANQDTPAMTVCQ